MKRDGWFAQAAVGALEAGALAVLVVAVLRRFPVDPQTVRGVSGGLGTAWVATTAGLCLLALGARSSPRVFWFCFGAGIALRLAALTALAAYVWHGPWEEAAAWLGSYAIGAAAMMLLEFRRLGMRDALRTRD